MHAWPTIDFLGRLTWSPVYGLAQLDALPRSSLRTLSSEAPKPGVPVGQGPAGLEKALGPSTDRITIAHPSVQAKRL